MELFRCGGQGKPKTGGRQKGTLNKTLTLLKDAILEAADTAAGKEGLVGYLRSQARENPVAFMGLLDKLVPSPIAAEVTQRVATSRNKAGEVGLASLGLKSSASYLTFGTGLCSQATILLRSFLCTQQALYRLPYLPRRERQVLVIGLVSTF